MATYEVEQRRSGLFLFVCPRCGEIIERRSGRTASRIAGQHYERHETGAQIDERL